MNTFYCVNVEFYDSGKTLACITTSEKRVRSNHRNVPGMTAFKMCWASESHATQLLENIQNGSIDCEDVLSIWSDWQDYENGMFFKGVAA